MNRYIIEHNKNQRQKEIFALSFEDTKTQFVFYGAENNKIITCSYNKYIWDIVEINIDKNED